MQKNSDALVGPCQRVDGLAQIFRLVAGDFLAVVPEGKNAKVECAVGFGKSSNGELQRRGFASLDAAERSFRLIERILCKRIRNYYPGFFR